MKTSVELTLYPLKDNYLPLIKAFIEHLHSYEGLSLQTFPTATIMIGEHAVVMQALSDAIAWHTENQGKAVFVSKILPNYEAR